MAYPNPNPNPYPYPYPNPSSTSNQPFPNPVSIIGPHFCAPYPVDLAIIKKDFVVIDINGNILFKVKEKFLSLHGRRVLFDGAGNPIVTLKPKIMSAHDRWQVFKGDSTDASDLLFSARRSSMFQSKTEVDVFLANNTKEEVCDFKVKGSWSERSFVVYAGESSTIVSQMHKKHTVENILIEKDKFMVTVYPNIDYAFIVALVVIHDGLNSSEEGGGRVEVEVEVEAGGDFDVFGWLN